MAWIDVRAVRESESNTRPRGMRGFVAGRLFPLLLIVGALGFNPAQAAQADSLAPKYPQLPSEIPAAFKPVTDSFDYVKREEMIPMRDGVKLHTVIVVPRGAKGAPILLTRTPYKADKYLSGRWSSHMGMLLAGDNASELILEDGYIRVFQDIRGKYGSEGDYVLTRQIAGPLNPTPVDHATDTWDTIDWLVKNIPESNGKVGIIGTSYNGFLSLMGLINPHPALKAAVPINPMVDGWIGDDWFHYGAFRLVSLPYIYSQESTRGSDFGWWPRFSDEYVEGLEAVSTAALGRSRGLEQVGFWRKILEHPNYDSFWRDQAMDKILAAQPLKVPVMLIHGLWDQEDIYGAPAVYRALEPKDTGNDMVYMVLGPWSHGQASREGSTLGAVRFNFDTALYFRQNFLRPFLAQHLLDRAPAQRVPPVAAFETGTNRWLCLDSWPSTGESRQSIQPAPLYLKAGLKMGFDAPKAGDTEYDEYVSDPSKPIPYRARPIPAAGYDEERGWSRWLTDDQREASSRPDVLAFVTDVLTEPVKISGIPEVSLVASTSGTDSDWVVKLIDVYPDEVFNQPDMGGYQLMISADIFRGRFRESFEHPKALAADKPLAYSFSLPTANHVFLPGHRIMVQVQSTWFPLYDRNPQTFVPDIFQARPEDFRKAVQRVYHSPTQSSFIRLPLVKGL